MIETNLENSLFIFNNIADTPLWNCKIHGNNFEKNQYKGLSTMVGQRKKNLSLEPLKRLFHHSENTFFFLQKNKLNLV